MTITISGSTGISGVDGTASSPALQGADTDTGVFYPAANQVAITTGGVQRLLVDATGTVTTGVGALYPLVSGTAVASTSGTSIDFTGIPSWVKRVTVMFNGVSTNGTSVVQIQLGTSSGATTTGYAVAAGSGVGGASPTVTQPTTGFPIVADGNVAYIRQGHLVVTNVSSNTWVASGTGGESAAGRWWVVGGSIALAATLDRVRVTTGNGTDTFDAGSINILYEG